MRVDKIDLEPQGEPETVVVLPAGTLVGLHIRGVLGDTMLGIREDELGRPEACAITNWIHVDTHQSNPRRHTDEDGA